MSEPNGEVPLELPIILEPADPRRQYSAASIKDLMHELLEERGGEMPSDKISDVPSTPLDIPTPQTLKLYGDPLFAARSEEELREMREATDSVIATEETSEVQVIEHVDAASPNLKHYSDALDAAKGDEETTE